MKRVATVLLVASLALVGCSPGQPQGGAASGFKVSGYAAPLSDSEFNSMSAEQQYQVLSKLLATVFKGMPVEEFFDLSAGLANPRVKFSNGLAKVRAALQTPLSEAQRSAIDAAIDGLDSEGNAHQEAALYVFDNDRPRSVPLARIHEYPVSHDGFVNWMAYFLSNTIMFSPALEMESTDIIDVQNTFRRLALMMEQGNTVREIIRAHLSTLDRWRVSRSSENHALEAYELYLGLFDTEEDSRRGGIACQDLYLTDQDEGYQLARTDFPNTVPQLILDDLFEVTTCDDFNDVIASHPLIMPRATEVIVNYLMNERTLTDRLSMVQSIVQSMAATGRGTFEEIFSAIIFSRQYLMSTERPKSFEETLMALLDTTRWSARFNAGEVGARIFDNMTSDPNDRVFMGAMGWDSMSLKIGRTPFVPMDSLSFANHHKAVREEFLRNTNAYRGRTVTVQTEDPDTGDLVPTDVIVGSLTRGDDGQGAVRLLAALADLTPQDYLHFLFLTAAQRRASGVELTDLMALFDAGLGLFPDTNGDGSPEVTTNGNRDLEIARQTFDYISRLPEFYYFKSIN